MQTNVELPLQPFGFHLSDGTVYTYLDGNEYEDIAAAWDWNLISVKSRQIMPPHR